MKKILILLSILFFSGVLFAQKSKEKKVLDISATEIWIDRFDNATGTCITKGSWFAYNDKGNEGASVISPSEFKNAYRTFPERNENRGLEFSYSLDKGNFKWEPYVGFGVGVADSSISVSIENIKGIAYDYKGSRHQMVFQLSTVKDFAHYRRIVPESEEWKTMIIPLTEFRQPVGWGKPVELLPQMLEALQWMMVGRTGDTGRLCIDNVRILRKLPKEPIEETKTVTEVAPKTNSVVKPIEQLRPVVSDKVEIATWPEFRKAAYSLTFDDGLLSQHQYVKPLLDKYNLKATFYVMPGSLSFDSTKAPSWRFGYWHHFAAMSRSGHEIGAHTVGHTDLTSLPSGKATSSGTLQYELTEPMKVFSQKLPNQKVISFAYPMGAFNEKVQQETALYYASARALGNGYNTANPGNWMNLQSYSINYTPGRTRERDLENISKIKSSVQNTTIANGGWSIFLAHDVLPFDQAIEAKDTWQPVSSESLDTLTKWLGEKQKSQELWVAPVGDVTRYIKERQSCSVVLLEETSDKMRFSFTDNLPDDVYGFPLTLSVKVPETWKKVSVKQNGMEIKSSIENNRVVLQARPDKGVIELTTP